MIRVLCLLLGLLPGLAGAEDWDALAQPGAFALMRHALAPGMNEPGVVDMTDCATQRNLDDAGRAQARAIGAAFRARGITFDRVLSSQWCRCHETAKLLRLGPPAVEPLLNTMTGQDADKDRRVADIRALIAAGKGRVLYVTHQDIIRTLTGLGTASGEVLILRADGAELTLLGRVLIDP